MIRVRASRPGDLPHTIAIWRAAVAATHHFLDPGDYIAIERMVTEDYLPSAPLWIAAYDPDEVMGFMGMTGAKIDSLFVDPAHYRRGVGRRLVDHAASLHRDLRVDVNEQNAGAVDFYVRMGFLPVGRSPLDDEGRPYPILHMRRRSEWLPGTDSNHRPTG